MDQVSKQNRSQGAYCVQSSLKLRMRFMGTTMDRGTRERGGARFFKLLMHFKKCGQEVVLERSETNNKIHMVQLHS